MGPAAKPVVCIVTPGTRSANNGNWRTAVRWAEMLRGRYRVIVQTAWRGERADALLAPPPPPRPASIPALRERPARGIAGVLTRTDLHRGRAARALQGSAPRYRYPAPLPPGLRRAAIQAAHLLVPPSVAEGGANVLVEAITAGTPVLASRISGNIGMLGRRYPGYFEPGDE